LPSISNFFVMPPYARAYLRIRDSGVLDSTSRAKIEKDLAFSLDHIFHFPEWGAHNRAMLRAESLYYGSVALPQHPNAAKWRRMAETTGSDSLGHWEIEGRFGLSGHLALRTLLLRRDKRPPEIYQSIQVRYYLDYFVQLLTPHGNIADFGDSHWNGNWERFVAIFEKAASVYQNPQYKFVAQELTKRALGRMRGGEASLAVGSGVGSAFTDASAGLTMRSRQSNRSRSVRRFWKTSSAKRSPFATVGTDEYLLITQLSRRRRRRHPWARLSATDDFS
jgi:hypothetical protein